MSMYNLGKYGDNYLKLSGSSFKFELKTTGQNTDDVPLSNFTKFSRTVEMSLKNFKISFQSNMAINLRCYQFNKRRKI